MDKQTLLKILHEDAVHAAARSLKNPRVADLWHPDCVTMDYLEGFKDAKRQMYAMKYAEFEKQMIFNETLEKAI